MPSSKSRRDARTRANRIPKNKAPLTKDTLLNDLNNDLTTTICWHTIVENSEGDKLVHAKESLNAAAKSFFASSRAFTNRIDGIQLPSFPSRPAPPHLTDNQRFRVMKLLEEVEEEIERRSKEHYESEPRDTSKVLPALDGFMQAFGLTTGEEEVFWLPKKRTRFTVDPSPAEEPVKEHGECTLLACWVLPMWFTDFITEEFRDEAPNGDPTRSFRGSFSAGSGIDYEKVAALLSSCGDGNGKKM